MNETRTYIGTGKWLDPPSHEAVPYRVEVSPEDAGMHVCVWTYSRPVMRGGELMTTATSKISAAELERFTGPTGGWTLLDPSTQLPEGL